MRYICTVSAIYVYLFYLIVLLASVGYVALLILDGRRLGISRKAGR